MMNNLLRLADKAIVGYYTMEAPLNGLAYAETAAQRLALLKTAQVRITEFRYSVMELEDAVDAAISKTLEEVRGGGPDSNDTSEG